MSTQAERRLARARAQEAKRRRRAAETYSAQTEQRLSGIWLVQAAAWLRLVIGETRAWRVMGWAMRHVTIYQRQFGGPWYRVSAHLEVNPRDGSITVHPTGSGEPAP